MKRRQGSKSTVVESGETTARSAPEAETTTAAPVPHDVSDSPLYGVAMLKIAMELKKPNAGELEDILSGVLTRMKLSEEDFRAFLAKNGGMLRAIANRRKY
ncbi:MAG: hypothetical protein M3Y59_20640 [Myxococcota bacterium]|nr:hypothetical protein [Myxococcota bacterium]